MSPSALLDGTFARRLERLSLVTRRRLAGHGQGDRRSLRKGSSLEFADYRHYVPGDDPNRVDWNVYARTGALFVRVYEEEEVLNVHLLLDASRSMDWGEPNKLAYARRLAAALGYLALNASNRLFVRPLGSESAPFGPAWGRARAGPLLAYLDGVQASSTAPPPLSVAPPAPPDLDGDLRAAGNQAGGLTMFLSDLLAPGWEQALGRLAGQAAEAVVLHILAPQELRPALGGDVKLIDRESGGSVAVTLNADALRLYDARLVKWRRQVESFCARYGMHYVPVDTSVPVEALVLETLRRRRVIR